MHASLLLCAAAGVAAVLGCQPGSANPPSEAVQAGPAASSAGPLDAFSRLVGGRWKMTTTAGRDTYDTWIWGPGEQSIRSMRLGTQPIGE